RNMYGCCVGTRTAGRSRPFTGISRAMIPGAEATPMADSSMLTSRQQEIYDFICQRIDDRGFPPTIRDIGTAFAIKSPNGVMCHLKALEKKGFIVREGKSARAIRPTQRIVPKSGLPFKGLVAAGAPIAAEAQEE